MILLLKNYYATILSIYKTHPPIPHHALYRQNCYIFEDIIDEKKSKSSIFIDSLILILHFYQKNKVLKTNIVNQTQSSLFEFQFSM